MIGQLGLRGVSVLESSGDTGAYLHYLSRPCTNSLGQASEPPVNPTTARSLHNSRLSSQVPVPTSLPLAVPRQSVPKWHGMRARAGSAITLASHLINSRPSPTTSRTKSVPQHSHTTSRSSTAAVAASRTSPPTASLPSKFTQPLDDPTLTKYHHGKDRKEKR